MSKQLVREGTQTNLYLRIVVTRILFIECMHEVRSATRTPLRECEKSLQFGKYL